MSKYGFSVELKTDFNQAIEKVTAALKTEGFGVLTDIDVQATMKAKLNIDKKPYRILGACNPSLANQAIDSEPDIGLLLPCNVVVREEAPGKVIVAFMDPIPVMAMVEKPEVHKLATEVREKLNRVSSLVKA